MQTVKKNIALILFAAFVITLNEGCKKGEGDPTLSLRSRKSRVVGEWSVSSWLDSFTETTTDPSGIDTYESEVKVDGSTVTMRDKSISGGNTSEVVAKGSVTSYDIDFMKDGTFKIVRIFKDVTSVDSADIFGQTIITKLVRDEEQIITGTWNFLGGVEEEFKNKERIVLNTLSETSTVDEDSEVDYNGTVYTSTQKMVSESTFAQGENTSILHLNTLRNNEIIMDSEYNQEGESTVTTTQGGNTTTYQSSYETVGSFSATMTK